jgi:hypothetical protein
MSGVCWLIWCALDALKIVTPETVIRWRAGFQAYWRWESPPRRLASDTGRDSPTHSGDEAADALSIPEPVT